MSEMAFESVASPLNVFPVAGAWVFIEEALVTPEVDAWATERDDECSVFYVRGNAHTFIRQFQWSRTGTVYIGSDADVLDAVMREFPWITCYRVCP